MLLTVIIKDVGIHDWDIAMDPRMYQELLEPYAQESQTRPASKRYEGHRAGYPGASHASRRDGSSQYEKGPTVPVE
jgi:hypothetical protein